MRKANENGVTLFSKLPGKQKAKPICGLAFVSELLYRN